MPTIWSQHVQNIVLTKMIQQDITIAITKQVLKTAWKAGTEVVV